jgi:hypothetical protein
MSKTRDKPMTSQTKAALMDEVIEKLITRWPNDPKAAMEFSLNFFTSNDLVGIKAELDALGTRR